MSVVITQSTYILTADIKTDEREGTFCGNILTGFVGIEHLVFDHKPHPLPTLLLLVLEVSLDSDVFVGCAHLF